MDMIELLRVSRLFRLMSLVVLALGVPAVAWALGLGPIQSNTRIGQDFKARVPLINVEASSIEGVKVRLADSSAYRQAGLSMPDYLFSLKFSVVRDANGFYVLITSRKPVRLPFINLLVHVGWPSGELTRQYTVLLNPPIFASNSSGVSAAGINTPVAPEHYPSITSTPTVAPTPVQPVVPPPARPLGASSGRVTPTASALPTTYGPIPRGATLWGLAHRLRPSSAITINQMMVALYRANPGAFYGNINRLKAGYILRIPAREVALAVTRGVATREVIRQDRVWRGSLKPAVLGLEAGSGPSRVKTPSTRESAATGAEKVGPSKQVVSQGEAPAARGGQVILSAPTLVVPTATASGSEAAVNPVSAATSVAPGTVAAVAAAAAGKGASSGTAGRAGTTTKIAGAAAPVKIKSQTFSRLSSGPPQKKPLVRSRTPGLTFPQKPSAGVFENWVTTPKGWILAGGLILLLFAGLLLGYRRMRGKRLKTQPGGGILPAPEASEANAEAPELLSPEADETVQEILPEDSGEHGRTYIGGPAVPVDEADTLAQAEFHAGYGHRDKAIQVLRDALIRDPQRRDIRLKLLELLFDAGEAEAFREQVVELDGLLGTHRDPDWEQVAVMGRQLLPQDPLFTASSAPDSVPPDTPAAAAVSPSADSLGQPSASLNFEAALDRLSETLATIPDEQKEFEQTLEELSTFIETYVPGEGEAHLDLQLPTDETVNRPAPEVVAKDDEPLEFNLSEEDLPTPEVDLALEFERDAALPDAISTKLDLARAYIDMGDADSARSILEEVIDEGDETRRQEARELLDTIQ